MPRQSLLQLEKPRRRSLGMPRLPLRIALVLPAQVFMLLVVAVPTLIVLWLSLTDWQPTDNIPWFKAEIVSAVLRTLFVVAVCVSVELCLAVVLALLFLDEWPWRKIAVSVKSRSALSSCR